MAIYFLQHVVDNDYHGDVWSRGTVCPGGCYKGLSNFIAYGVKSSLPGGDL